MSVLLVAPPHAIGSLVVERLIAQGDEVRVASPPTAPEHWQRLGAYVATGDPDADLIERAGQNTRSLVLFDPPDGVADAALEAAGAARIERVIVVTTGRSGGLPGLLEESGLGYVVLYTGRKRGFRYVVSGEQVAEAVDAADDLAGKVKLELDLAEPESRRALGLEP